MQEHIILDDFSAGLVLSDDPINGRKNGLLKMEGIELSKNGIVRMVGGTTRTLSAFSNSLHTLFSKYIGGTRYTYSADNTGIVFRNTTSIATSGSTTRACFNAAYNYVFAFSGNKRIKDTGATVTDLGIIKPSAAPTLSLGAAGVLTGDYDYCQINVLVNGSYQAKSARGTLASISPSAQIVTVTPQDPATPSSTGNEAWIFRRGGNLDTWYRIARVTTFGSFSDNLSDDDALALGITLNDFLLSVNSTDTPDAILACVGPIYGRLIYFTAKQIIFSDIASPDSYDSRNVIGLGASAGSENFKWAIKVSENQVMVGTDCDVYSLIGTFIQLPDGFLDVTLRPLAVVAPPLGIGVASYENAAIYMSKLGWVVCTLNGQIITLTAPNIDRMYQGETVSSYSPVLIGPALDRYECTIHNNKLYTITPLTSSIWHCAIYDFLRKNWSIVYSTLCPLMFYSAENNKLYGFDDTDKYIKIYADPNTKLLDDGSSSKQAVALRTVFQDNNKPRNPKDVCTLTFRGKTGSATIGVTVQVAYDGSTSFTNVGTFKSLNIGELSFDISGGTTDPGQIAKAIQIDLAGSPPDFELQDISISYNLRPQSELHLNIQDLGLDTTEYKFISTLNPIIDTHGQNVDFYPVVDGTVQTKSVINTSKKLLAPHYFTGVVGGSHWTGYFIAQTSTPFEFYGFLPATIDYAQVQYTKYKVLAAIELFRYGKLKELELRIATLAGATTIPYGLILDGGTPITGTLTVTANVELVYSITLPKTTAGSELIILLGATSVPFSVISARVLAAISGNLSDEKWIQVK